MKKAQIDVLSWFMNTLLLVVIVLMLFASTQKILSGTYYQEKSFSRNLAFFYDSVMASPAKTEVTYQIGQKSNLNIELNEDCQVKIKNIEGSENIFYCGLNTNSNTNCKTGSNCLVEKNLIAFKNG